MFHEKNNITKNSKFSDAVWPVERGAFLKRIVINLCWTKYNEINIFL